MARSRAARYRDETKSMIGALREKDWLASLQTGTPRVAPRQGMVSRLETFSPQNLRTPTNNWVDPAGRAQSTNEVMATTSAFGRQGQAIPRMNVNETIPRFQQGGAIGALPPLSAAQTKFHQNAIDAMHSRGGGLSGAIGEQRVAEKAAAAAAAKPVPKPVEVQVQEAKEAGLNKRVELANQHGLDMATLEAVNTSVENQTKGLHPGTAEYNAAQKAALDMETRKAELEGDQKAIDATNALQMEYYKAQLERSKGTEQVAGQRTVRLDGGGTATEPAPQPKYAGQGAVPAPSTPQAANQADLNQNGISDEDEAIMAQTQTSEYKAKNPLKAKAVLEAMKRKYPDIYGKK